MAVSANKLELLQIADAVAREKSIDRVIVISAMEDAIAKAAKSRYGAETEVRAEINPKSGELRLSRHMLVVDQVENPRPRSRWRMRAGTIRQPRSVTRSPTRFPRWNTAASRRSPQSRSSCRRCATRNATGSSRSSRTASARSSTASSSVSSTAM